MGLNDISLIVTAGHRAGYLQELLHGVSAFLPETTTIVVNDDDKDSEWFVPPAKTIWEQTKPDTFLTRKRNLGVQLVDTKYAALLADDFLINSDTRRVLIRMANILDMHTRPDVIAGTFNDRRYEGHLEVMKSEYIREHALQEEDWKIAPNLWQIDIAANFFLARTKLLNKVPWDETIGPIGGEHADWFLDVKAAGGVVTWQPGLNIYEQPKNADMESPDYGKRRARVWDGHALMLKKRGVKRYIGFGDKP
jgi:hypothetical protein